MIFRALKFLGFIKRNTTNFSSSYCLRVLSSSLVPSIMEYSVVVWHPHLSRDVLRMERVQIRFLSYAAFLLNHPQRDYFLIRSTLLLPSLVSRQIKADHSYKTSLLNGSLDSLDLVSSISFRVPTHNTRIRCLFPLPHHHTSYRQNYPIHRMLRNLEMFNPDLIFS
jgi:hypothetical protein